MNNFYIKVTARSQEELDKRIDDNIKKGFKVHKIHQPDVTTSDYIDYNYDSSGFKKYRKKNTSRDIYIKYQAVMVRESRKAENVC